MTTDLMSQLADDIVETVKEGVRNGVKTLVESRLSALQARIDDIEKRVAKLEESR